jgi:hypothetical protein
MKGIVNTFMLFLAFYGKKELFCDYFIMLFSASGEL